MLMHVTVINPGLSLFPSFTGSRGLTYLGFRSLRHDCSRATLIKVIRICDELSLHCDI
jgi:hypothetical protein